MMKTKFVRYSFSTPRTSALVLLLVALSVADTAFAHSSGGRTRRKEELLIGPAFGVLHDLDQPSWVVGGSLGFAIRGRGLVL